MNATATSPSQRESEMRKPSGRANSDSQMTETSMQENLAKLAYTLWQQRGCPEGSSEFDWFEAERKLRESAERVSR